MAKAAIDVVVGVPAMRERTGRAGRRGAGNLLLPKLDGATGSHYQGRKACMYELIFEVPNV